MRPKALAFLDVATSGLSPERDQILELGIVRVDARSLEVTAEHEVLVAPDHLADADPAALRLCGFSPAAWAHASPLRDALLSVRPLLEGTLVAGHHIGFAWSFLEEGFRQSGLAPPRIHLHRLDTASLAWPLWAAGQVQTLSLDALARSFGLERALPQHALANARLALEVARRFVDRAPLSGRVPPQLRNDLELHLVEREDAPVLDLPASLAESADFDDAHTAEWSMPSLPEVEVRHRRIYVCHPFAEDPDRNLSRVLSISRRLVARGVLPVTPQLYLPQLLEDGVGPDQARTLRLGLVDACDELRVFSSRVTSEMAQELEHAHKRHIPVAFEPEVLA